MTRKLTHEEITKRVKYSLFEHRYLVLAEDGATVIGRSFVKETAIGMLKAYHVAREALVRKGKISSDNFKSQIHGDVPLVPEGLSAGQRKAMDETQNERTIKRLSDEGALVIPPKDYPVN